MSIPGSKISVDEPPLLQVGHATCNLHGILTESVDQHWTLWTNASQTLQQRSQRSQLSDLQSREEEGGEKNGKAKLYLYLLSRKKV